MRSSQKLSPNLSAFVYWTLPRPSRWLAFNIKLVIAFVTQSAAHDLKREEFDVPRAHVLIANVFTIASADSAGNDPRSSVDRYAFSGFADD